jgi:hypothetical protein
MRVSWWSQKWTHDEIIAASPEDAYSQLLQYYKRSARSFVLESEVPGECFSFWRGNKLMSLLGLGSERWFKHHIEVSVQGSNSGESEVSWNIDLKIFGLQAGTNAIIEECQQIARQVA